jgi:hypothetical protein
MPQTTYTSDYTAALAGQIADNSASECVSYVCSEAIEAGRFVELHTDGKVRNPQGTTLTKPVGVAVYQVSDLPGGYAAGDVVCVMRKGRIYAQITGSAPGELVAANINHSSTVATDRGKLTTTATSAGAGTEISALEGCRFVKSGPSGLGQVELNLPA